MGCFPSRGVPGHWKGTVCRHQSHGGWRRVSPGGSSRRGSSSPLGGNYYPRRTPSPPAGRTGTAPHTPRPPGPAPLPEANQPRRGAGAQTARRVRAAPSCPLSSSRLAVRRLGLSDCPAALRNGRGSRWPRRAELFLGRCKRRRAEPLRRGPGSTRSGRARSDASRVLARRSRGRATALSLVSPAQVWAPPSPLASAAVAAPRLRLLSAAPPDCCCIPAGRAAPAARLHQRPSAAAPRAAPAL